MRCRQPASPAPCRRAFGRPRALWVLAAARPAGEPSGDARHDAVAPCAEGAPEGPVHGWTGDRARPVCPRPDPVPKSLRAIPHALGAGGSAPCRTAGGRFRTPVGLGGPASCPGSLGNRNIPEAQVCWRVSGSGLGRSPVWTEPLGIRPGVRGDAPPTPRAGALFRRRSCLRRDRARASSEPRPRRAAPPTCRQPSAFTVGRIRIPGTGKGLPTAQPGACTAPGDRGAMAGIAGPGRGGRPWAFGRVRDEAGCEALAKNLLRISVCLHFFLDGSGALSRPRRRAFRGSETSRAASSRLETSWTRPRPPAQTFRSDLWFRPKSLFESA
jgi:hypothetical protein